MLDNRTYKIKGWFQIVVPLIVLPFLYYANDMHLLMWSLLLCIFAPTISFISHHRIASHEIADLHVGLKIPLTLFGTIFLTSPPISWAALHKLHHTYTDTNLDPHSPMFIGRWKTWLFIYHKQIHQIMDQMSLKQKKKWIVSFKKAMKDPVYKFVETYYLLIVTLYISTLAMLNPSFVIYFFALPMLACHFAEMLVIMNHGGFLGGNKIKGNHARNFFVGFLFSGSEWKHADHHNNPRSPDLINRLLWKISTS